MNYYSKYYLKIGAAGGAWADALDRLDGGRADSVGEGHVLDERSQLLVVGRVVVGRSGEVDPALKRSRSPDDSFPDKNDKYFSTRSQNLSSNLKANEP